MKSRAVLAVLASFLVFVTPAAAAVPSGFLPSSISWLTAKHGAVMGYAPCGGDMCPHLLFTADGGDSWRERNAPQVKLPDNHNQVKLTVVDATNAFVSNGEALWATNDASNTWYQVKLAGLQAPLFISKVLIAHNRVFAVASALGNGEADYTQIYSSPIGGRTLRPMRSLRATGDLTFGDISFDRGVLQVYLGADFARAEYGLSSDGVRFTAAPLPCPLDKFATLGGVQEGKPTVLCNGSGGSPAPGHMTKQVFVAPRLGGKFAPIDEAPTAGINQGFGPASPESFTVAAVGGGVCFLHHSPDAGKNWSTTMLSERGFGLFDLRFVTHQVGYVVDGVPDGGGSAVFRTTDSGKSWQEIVF